MFKFTGTYYIHASLSSILFNFFRFYYFSSNLLSCIKFADFASFCKVCECCNTLSAFSVPEVGLECGRGCVHSGSPFTTSSSSCISLSMLVWRARASSTADCAFFSPLLLKLHHNNRMSTTRNTTPLSIQYSGLHNSYIPGNELPNLVAQDSGECMQQMTFFLSEACFIQK